MDGGAWRATVHGVTKSWTRLSDLHFLSSSGVETDAVVTVQAGERVVAWPGP